MIANLKHDQSRRLGALRKLLDAEGLGCALLSRPEHVFYFTGYLPGLRPALLIVLPRTQIAVAPQPLPGVDTVPYTSYDIYKGWDIDEGVAHALVQAIAGRGLELQSIGCELGHLPSSWLSAIGGHTGEPRDLAPVLWQVRHVKDDAEIAQIEASARLNDHLFETVQHVLEPGMTEVAVWAAMFRTLCDDADGPAVLDGDLGGGIRSSYPDSKPTLQTLNGGDQLFIDLYPGSDGYYADTTRSFVLGTPSAMQKRVHGVLEEALAAGEQALTPGTRACDVDAAVRGIMEAAGFGPNFPHHSGHGFGLFAQETPFLIPAEETCLEAGMTFTLEPGIYIEGWGGMRLEGNYEITGDGPRRLDRFPSTLTVC
jgi:Xaa-Pro dipeptidase